MSSTLEIQALGSRESVDEGGRQRPASRSSPSLPHPPGKAHGGAAATDDVQASCSNRPAQMRVVISGNRAPALPFSSMEALTRRPSAVFYCQFQNQQKEEKEKSRFRWMEVRPIATPRQKEAISNLPFKMTNRCKGLLRQIIIRHDPSLPLPANSDDLHSLLSEWAELMKPARCDWLDVIKQLSFMNHPLHLPVIPVLLN